MPYIKKSDRRDLDLELRAPKNPGELNYKISKLLRDYLMEHGLSYGVINDVIGATESAKIEFYRRIAIPLERQKIQENGDVY